VDGPPVLLGAPAAISIGMAMHELAANAAGHGALSVPQGRVHFGWAIEDDDGGNGRLVIRWRESGGPPVRPPQSKGYGSTLIEAELMEKIGARGSLTFVETGVAADLALPLSSRLVQLPGVENNHRSRQN
jgi:two-component sensor histidine kinase